VLRVSTLYIRSASLSNSAKEVRGGGTLEAEEESAGPRGGARAEEEENGEQSDREEEGKRRRKTKEVSKETERGLGDRAKGTCRA